MSFNSVEFGVFFIFVTTFFFLLPYQRRGHFLLLASIYFYACWQPLYLLPLAFATGVDFWVGKLLGVTEDESQRKRLLALSLGLNLGTLFIFKYAGFVTSNIIGLGKLLEVSLPDLSINLLLPVGISFYTFQTMAYTIDVYRRRMEPILDFRLFALYVTYYPQLVAGPIERAQHLVPELEKKSTFDYQRAKEGLALMLWGFFKKIAVADRLAPLVEEVYKQPQNCSGPDLILGTIAFAFQIYGDFSGYSDIAIGASKIMGIDLMDNFNRPYMAVSVRDFWARWHISLTTWFRDYVYMPLGGNRVSLPKWYRNILIIFVVSGLWHGAKWTFVFWGLLHSFYYFVERTFSDKVKLPTILARTLTFLAVCFAWIFFRADSLPQALSIIAGLPSGWTKGAPVVTSLPLNYLLLNLFTLGLMLALEHYQGNEGPPRAQFKGNVVIRWSIYYLLLFSLILFGNYDSHAFIYFQF